jgi:hypothetical protein
VTEVLSQRGLNRATLARQYLLERASAPAIDMIEHLGGMQSQAPLAPYVGLWTRLQGFAPGELSALTEERQVVRLSLMRNTVHLVSARDCLGWRPLSYPLHTAEFRAHYRSGTEGRWQVAGFPALDAIGCPDLRSTSSADQPGLRGWRRSPKGSACATRADVQRGRRGKWTSSLDRVPQVSEAIRCRGDIRAVQFWRFAAGMLDESRYRLRS